tara:strand:+ start:2397 stop:3230 length:834 start_codon:yes stop_codon:yes gene_type:complete
MWWDILKVNFEFDPNMKTVGGYQRWGDKITLHPKAFLDPNDPDGVNWEYFMEVLLHENIHAGQAHALSEENAGHFYKLMDLIRSSEKKNIEHIESLFSEYYGGSYMTEDGMEYYTPRPKFDPQKTKMLGRELNKIPKMIKQGYTDEMAKLILADYQWSLMKELQANTPVLQEGKVKDTIALSIQSANIMLDSVFENINEMELALKEFLEEELNKVYRITRGGSPASGNTKQSIRSQSLRLSNYLLGGTMFNDYYNKKVIPLIEQERLKFKESVKGFK